MSSQGNLLTSIKPSFRIGDLVWHQEAKNGRLWWPAMVTYDPNVGIYFRMKNCVQYHVQFFGLTAMRGWVSIKSMKVLSSSSELGLPERGVSKKIRKEFEVATKEVADALKVDYKQRKLKFIFNFGPVMNSTENNEEKKKPLSPEEQMALKSKTSSVGKQESAALGNVNGEKQARIAQGPDMSTDTDSRPVRTVRRKRPYSGEGVDTEMDSGNRPVRTVRSKHTREGVDTEMDSGSRPVRTVRSKHTREGVDTEMDSGSRPVRTVRSKHTREGVDTEMDSGSRPVRTVRSKHTRESGDTEMDSGSRPVRTVRSKHTREGVDTEMDSGNRPVRTVRSKHTREGVDTEMDSGNRPVRTVRSKHTREGVDTEMDSGNRPVRTVRSKHTREGVDTEMDSSNRPVRTVRKQARIMDSMKQNESKPDLLPQPPMSSTIFPVLPLTSPTLFAQCNGPHTPLILPPPYTLDSSQEGIVMKAGITQQPYTLENHLGSALVPIHFEPNHISVPLCFQPPPFIDSQQHLVHQALTFPHQLMNCTPPIHFTHPPITPSHPDSSFPSTNPPPPGFCKQSTLGTLLLSESSSNDTSSEVSAPSAILTPPNSSTDEPTDSEIEHSSITKVEDTRVPTSKPPSVKVLKIDMSCLGSGVCSICDGEDVDLLPCSGHCYSMFHLDCLGLVQVPKFKFVCDECLLDLGKCFSCGKSDKPLLKCNKAKCTKLYHLACITDNKLFTFDERKKKMPVFTCPLHTCCRCTSIGLTDVTTTNLTQCIKCPLALHRQNCLIAGCEILNSTHMVCYQHLKVTRNANRYSHVNLNTCLDCGAIGSLYCCDICSAAYHIECLEEDSRPRPNTDVWKCPSCAVHDLPVYGSIVLSKFGIWRWWPSEVIEPSAIPDNIEARKAGDCMFVVRFCGTKDYSWMHHGRVIPYTGPFGSGSSNKVSSQNAVYRKALLEAEQLYQVKKEEREAIEAEQKKTDSKRFIKIKTNKYLVPRNTVNGLSLSFLPCQCIPDQPCNDDSSCVNRASHIECEPDCCPVGDLCRNQRLLKCQEAKTTPFHTGKRGWGLRVDYDLSVGDFVIEYIGEVLDTAMCKERLVKYHENRVSNFYMLTLDSGLVIDASQKSNNARFINHSCGPNCESQKWTVKGDTRIGIFARVNIPAGTELTFDYHLDSLGNEKKKCLCCSKNCSGFMGLKSTKVTTSAGDGLVKKKAVKQKRLKVKKMVREATLGEDTHDDDCFVCGDGGRLLLCDCRKCSKVYHLECLQRKVFPPKSQTWKCPRHFCQVCQKEAVTFCSSCPISYCKKHSSGKFGPEACDNTQSMCLRNCYSPPVKDDSQPMEEPVGEE